MTIDGLILKLLLGGLLGVLGQGARTVVGMKKLVDDANELNVSSSDLFVAGRLFTGFAIGFLVGMAAILPMDLPATIEWTFLLPVIAAGYAGTDFLEGFIGKYLTAASGPSPVASAVAARADLFRAAVRKFVPLAGANARQVVYDAIHETIHRTFDDATVLGDLGFDAVALGGLATKISRRIPVDTGAVQRCKKVGDVVAVAAAAA